MMALLFIGDLSVCFPLLLVGALLVAAVYARGSDPLSAFDITSPKGAKIKSYKSKGLWKYDSDFKRVLRRAGATASTLKANALDLATRGKYGAGVGAFQAKGGEALTVSSGTAMSRMFAARNSGKGVWDSLRAGAEGSFNNKNTRQVFTTDKNGKVSSVMWDKNPDGSWKLDAKGRHTSKYGIVNASDLISRGSAKHRSAFMRGGDPDMFFTDNTGTNRFLAPRNTREVENNAEVRDSKGNLIYSRGYGRDVGSLADLEARGMNLQAFRSAIFAVRRDLAEQ